MVRPLQGRASFCRNAKTISARLLVASRKPLIDRGNEVIGVPFQTIMSGKVRGDYLGQVVAGRHLRLHGRLRVGKHGPVSLKLHSGRDRAMSWHDANAVIGHPQRYIDSSNAALDGPAAIGVDVRIHSVEKDVTEIDHVGVAELYERIAIRVGIRDVQEFDILGAIAQR